MALIPQDQKKQAMILSVILCVGAAGYYWQMMWPEKKAELDVVQARVERLEMANRQAKQDIATGTAQQLEEEAREYGQRLEVLRRLVPTQNEVPALLEHISTAARRVGLEISDVAPDGVLKGDQFDVYKYRIGVTGPYHRVAEFLANVGSLERIVSPINLQLVPSGRTMPRRPKDELYLDARFQVQTYVARTVPQPVGDN